MAATVVPHLLLAAGAGVFGGLGLLARGLAAYRRGASIEGIGASLASSVAAGEVRVSGVVVPGPLVLVSPLQGVECVWYRASVTGSEGSGASATLLEEERATEFTVRDATGDIRVVPRDARWFAEPSFDDATSLLGAEPVGLRVGSGSWAVPSAIDRRTAVERLLAVRSPAATDRPSTFLRPRNAGSAARWRYRETRIEAGQHVTVVGYAEERSAADARRVASTAPEVDAEIAADLAVARAQGTLAADAQAAWGNAAIPGFGIGRPVDAPVLDPAVAVGAPRHAVAAVPEEALVTVDGTRFELDPHELVVGAGPDGRLEIHAGTPRDAAGRARDAFVLGLAGGVVAMASAAALAVLVDGALR